jgi:hypothetical protein
MRTQYITDPQPRQAFLFDNAEASAKAQVGVRKQAFKVGRDAYFALPYSFWERPGTLDFLAPSINYSSCRDVVQLYSVRH